MTKKERISEFLDKISGIPDNPCKSSLFNHISQAIDIIEAQAARIVELEAALNPFVPGYASWMDQFADGDLCGFARPVTFGHIRAARDALTKGE